MNLVKTFILLNAVSAFTLHAEAKSTEFCADLESQLEHEFVVSRAETDKQREALNSIQALIQSELAAEVDRATQFKNAFVEYNFAAGLSPFDEVNDEAYYLGLSQSVVDLFEELYGADVRRIIKEATNASDEDALAVTITMDRGLNLQHNLPFLMYINIPRVTDEFYSALSFGSSLTLFGLDEQKHMESVTQTRMYPKFPYYITKELAIAAELDRAGCWNQKVE